MRASDHTEPEATTREELEERYGHVWDIRELAREFVIIGLEGKRLRVRRKSDGIQGTLRISGDICFEFRICQAAANA